MAITLSRFIRFIRSTCVPATAIIGFSCLLTFFFVLYQPSRGPGDIQRLGWQSWDVVSPSPPSNRPSSANTSGHVDQQDDVDWWNVTDSSETPVDTTSLPLDVWSPLLPHDTGCTIFFRLSLGITLNCRIDSV